MKILKVSAKIIFIAIVPLLMGASNEREAKPVIAAEKVSGEKKSTDIQVMAVSKGAKKPDKLLYKPPLRGAPAGRVGGGTRGTTERESFSLQVLVPDHAGLTVSDQPALYWFISKPTTHSVELTVIERNAVKPLIEKVVKGPDIGGIQVIRLADYGVQLRRNIQYKWYVTLVTDADQRSKDILAGGIITLVDPSAALTEKLKSTDSGMAPYIYAEEGFWYDAFEALSGMINAAPDNAGLHLQRASLLEQVGLAEAAEFDNKQARQQSQ